MSLNQRLAEDIYLSVVPIYHSSAGPVLEESDGVIQEYAIKMKRMDTDRQMNILLEKDAVTFLHVEQLADQLATFHAYTDVIETPLNLDYLQTNFSDIQKIQTIIENKFGEEIWQLVEEAITYSQYFLNKYHSRFEERHREGFTVDGHGDLHAENIFILDQPVIFDCIEFNDTFRQLDVLDDLAFLCMDLDCFGREDLEMHLMQTYMLKHPCIFNEIDHLIFHYYKMYRANVRMKVNTYKALQAALPADREKYFAKVEAYFFLIKRYLNYLKETETEPLTIN